MAAMRFGHVLGFGGVLAAQEAAEVAGDAATAEEDLPADVDDTIAALDEAMVVHEALAILSGDCREILDRFFAQDQSYRTIGDALELPAGTIASRISRCLKKLREQLQWKNPSESSV